MSEWYYMSGGSGGQQHGPVTAAQLKALASSGGLVPEDLVWNQSMPEWVPARRVRGLPFAGQPQAAKAPAPAAPARPAARAAATAATVRSAPPAEAEPAQPFLSEPASSPQEYEQVATAPVHDTRSAPAKAAHTEPADRSHVRTAPRAAMESTPIHAVELYGKTRNPLRLLSFMTFLLMLCGLAAGGFAGLTQFDKARKVLTATVETQGKKLHTPTDVEFMAVAGLYTFLAFILMICLMRYSSRIGKLRATFGAEELEKVVKAQTSLWRLVALVMFLTIGLSAVGYMRYVMHIMWW